MTADIQLVVARADNGVIGRDGALPSHLPADLRRFKRVTMGSALIMGRRTFESLPGLLPGRRHIVLTHDPSWQARGAHAAHSVENALAHAGEERISVIGGAEIFALFLPLAQSVELTEVHRDVGGETRLPAFDPSEWREVAREDHGADEGKPAFSFVRLVRRLD